jgi:hypothetical protein
MIFNILILNVRAPLQSFFTSWHFKKSLNFTPDMQLECYTFQTINFDKVLFYTSKAVCFHDVEYAENRRDDASKLFNDFNDSLNFTTGIEKDKFNVISDQFLIKMSESTVAEADDMLNAVKVGKGYGNYFSMNAELQKAFYDKEYSCYFQDVVKAHTSNPKELTDVAKVLETDLRLVVT